jgi:hypothetical protein
MEYEDERLLKLVFPKLPGEQNGQISKSQPAIFSFQTHSFLSLTVGYLGHDSMVKYSFLLEVAERHLNNLFYLKFNEI